MQSSVEVTAQLYRPSGQLLKEQVITATQHFGKTGVEQEDGPLVFGDNIDLTTLEPQKFLRSTAIGRFQLDGGVPTFLLVRGSESETFSLSEGPDSHDFQLTDLQGLPLTLRLFYPAKTETAVL